ncbi:MAG: secretion protein F [Clostridia bacterium]|nr:secretion protein F [Clostridia bacterium]
MSNGIIFSILAMFVFFLSCGVYMVTADYLSLPTFKASLTVFNVSRQQRQKRYSFDAYVLELSSKLSRFIRIDEYRKRKLSVTLKSAGIYLSPETYIARAWVKAGLVFLGIIPALIIFPVLSFIMLFLSILIYFKERRSADEIMKKKRNEIESELSRFVMTLEQEFKASRDVLKILEAYKKNSSPALRNELEITIADMKSGSYEAALSRFEARVGSAMLSDVVRGLLSVLNGDDGKVYFQMLVHDFKQIELQKLKLIAMKRPSKMRRYSFFMLGCFVLIYITVMAIEIMKAFSTMF